MPANLENSTVATGLEKVSFHSNPKEKQCQSMLKLLHNCTHLTRWQIMLRTLQARLQWWTENFQRYKQDLEKAEELEIKLPSAGSEKKQKNPRKTSASLSLLKHLIVWITTNCGKFFKRWEYQTCLLRNLYAGQEAKIRIRHGPMDWFQIEKGVCQSCISSPCLFNLYAEYIMWNARLDEASWNQDCWEKYQ